MWRHRSYWTYSAACFIAWGVLLGISAARSGSALHNLLLVSAGWVIAWVSTTIARFVYPPPKRWLSAKPPAP